MKKNIEKKDAKKNWDNPLKKLLLRSLFATFEDYWKECENFNSLSDTEKYEQKKEATAFIKRVKIKNALNSLH